MLDFLADAAVNTATGGIFGLVGTGIHAVLKGVGDSMASRHEREMRRLDIEALEVESRLRIQEMQKKTEAQIAVAEMALTEAEVAAELQTIQQSYDSDKASYGIAFVDGVRGLMRPTITAFLIFATYLVTYDLWHLTQEIKPDAAQAWELFEGVVAQLMFLTATAVTWWFGSRPLKGAKR